MTYDKVDFHNNYIMHRNLTGYKSLTIGTISMSILKATLHTLQTPSSEEGTFKAIKLYII